MLGILALSAGAGWAQKAPSAAPASPKEPTGQFDREAFTITRWDLNVAIDTQLQTLGSRGKIYLRNDSGLPQNAVPLQISSSLRWSSIRMGGAPIEFTSAKSRSDIDHTGAVNEAVLQLPQPVQPGSSIELEIGYAGYITQDASRLERVGTPAGVARRSDWDRITESFTGVRGIGNVAWYPVSISPALLGDGNRLFESLERWKARHADSSFHVVYNTQREVTLIANAGQVVLVGGSTPGSVVESNLFRLGTQTPFFIAGKYRAVETARGKVFYFSSSEGVARSYADVLKTLETPFGRGKTANMAESSGRFAAAGARPSTQNESGMGVGKELQVALIELPEGSANFESGPALLLPLREMEQKRMQQLLIHTAIHGSFYSSRAWIYEGFAHYAQARLIEEQDGRGAALDFLEQRRGALALADSDVPTDSAARRSLVNTGNEIFYRSKAMFVWWMLHDMIGDAAIHKAITQYRMEEDKEPSYIERLLEAASGRNLNWFFNDWVYRDRGLPDFQITSVYPRENLKGGYMVTVSVENLGGAAAEVPIRLRTKEGEVTTRLEVRGKEKASARIEVRDRPLEVTVNDGSVPESDTNNNSFSIPLPR